jgi:type IV secretion system protein VirD4
LKFMQVPEIVDILSPPAGEGFDFASFLTSKDTLYLVASDTATSPVSPLFVAFLAELTHHARLHPARTGAKRLDPPLTLELDEIANIAPIPVHAWSTWAAGSGIRINMYGQAWSQFEQRWGKEGAETIWQAAKTKVLFTASSEKVLCDKVEHLCGKVRVRGEDEVTYDRRGRERRRRTFEDIDVLPSEAARMLPDNRAVVVRRNARPTIVVAEQVWKRKDVRAYQRSGEQVMLPPPPRRVIPTVRPELARPAQPLVPLHDDLAERRARRMPQDAPPLPTRTATIHPAGNSPQPTGTGDQEEPWRPWHGTRPTGE